ncbi:hypothetical protein [Ahniella affigens]|nr:hypothetical protein [Ahniella affigens]
MTKSTTLQSLLVLAVTVLLASCSPPEYPADWPKPVDAWLDRRGGCPDLSGDFDAVRTELIWLLLAERQKTAADKYHHEQRARFTQADDGNWLRIELSLNERGLRDYRANQLRFNLDDPMPFRRLTLYRDQDFQCRSGWLESLHYPEASSTTGVQRKLARFRRDADHGLVAETVSAVERTLSYSSATGAAFITQDEREWHRWPQRSPEADQRLGAEQSVTLYRYDWQNGPSSVPTRFNNYRMQPICLQLHVFGTVIAPAGPELRRSRDDVSPLPPQCPIGWGKFDPGETLRREFALPEYGGESQQIVWFPLEQGESGRQMILVNDAAHLPMMPER